MKQDSVPHLCGGIFFDLLLEARKPRRKAKNKFNHGGDGLNIPDVYIGLINIVSGEDYSSFSGRTLSKCATNYKKCDDSTGDYVPFTKVATQSAFKKLYKSNITCLLERTAGFIDRFLNKDNCVWLVTALIETMQKDISINDETMIAVDYEDALPVRQLHEAKKIVLLPFLLSVLHYVICNCPDCESGKATFNAWYSQAGAKNEWKFNSDIGRNFFTINVDTDLTIPSTLQFSSTSADYVQEEETLQEQKKQDSHEENPDSEHIDCEVVDDEMCHSNFGPCVTIIQNQTNIEHDESKTFNIKDSNVTFNL